MIESVIDHARHTSFSDPGRHARLFDDIPSDPAGVSLVARNLIAHYVTRRDELPAQTQPDVNARWIERALDLDQLRHPVPLSTERPLAERLQGCCRDHSLFCVSVLRSNGIPARSRVGYAGYFLETWNHDHVIVEAWIDDRWRRFDPEIEAPILDLATPLDIGTCDVGSRGFVSAAQVWDAFRHGHLDVDNYGVSNELAILRGERFVFDQVIYEVAHRFGDELLLWDSWGHIGAPDAPVEASDAKWADGVARFLLAADDGDLDAERALLGQYRIDDGLRPGPTVRQMSPFGDATVVIDLASRAPA